MKFKKIDFKIILLLIISLGIVIFVYNDDFLYKEEIMKISNVSTETTEVVQNYIGISEKHYNKIITGTITNGKNKNKVKTIKYDESYSSVITDKYKKNDKVFIKDNCIEGLKRDFYLTIMLVVFINFIYVVGSNKGLASVLSAVLNFMIFYYGIELYFKGINILFLCIVESFIFSVLSIFISNGVNKKSLSAILSVICSIIILLLMMLLVIKITNYSGINFNELKFLTVPVEDVILPELLIGCMGASMDIAITISSSISELIKKDNKISIKNLKKSAKEIGKDVMSTMSNVLFFTYLSASLPIYVLAIRNGFSIYNFMSSNFSLELSRFLVGSIGIIVTIPISSYISIKIFKRGDIYE